MQANLSLQRTVCQTSRDDLTPNEKSDILMKEMRE